MAKTRGDLVAQVARRLGNYRQGTATDGSTTTVVDTATLYEPSDFWVGHFVTIVEDAGGAGAAPEGQERPVVDYDQATATLTVDPAFSAAVGAGDTFELTKVRRADVVAAINAAIRAGGETWPVVVRDTTSVVIEDNDYDYDLPANLMRLLAVWARGAADEPWVLVPGRLWRVDDVPGGRVLLMDALRGLGDGDVVQLDYLARVAELDADADTLGVGEPAEAEMVQFIEEYAVFWLHDQLANRAPEGSGFRAHITQAGACEKRAVEIRRRATRFHGVGTVRTGRWARHR